jgi:hypothetical protein
VADIVSQLPTELVLARAVRVAVCRLPEVADLSPGGFAQAATYGPGEVVRGVVVSRVGGGLSVDVHLIARYNQALVLPDLANRVRAVVGRVAGTLGAELPQRIDVAFDDLLLPEGSLR